MALCKATGAEPMISVDIESHHPEMAAEIVKYCNIEKKYGVKYFEIGNEPEGYSGDAWPGRAWGGSKEDMALKYSLVGQYHLEYQDQMKAVDPGIIVLGPVSANMNYSDNTFPKFWATVGEKLDVMTFHTYPQDDIRTNKWGTNSLHISDELLFKKPMEWVNTMASMHKLEKEFSPGRHSLYALTEWNTSFAHPGPRQQQTVGAIWVAKNLCEMIKYGMDIANIWDIIGKGYYNLFPIEDGKLVIKPTAKIYKILSHNFQGEMIQVNSPISNLSVYASINNGALNLVAINTAPDAAYVGDLEIAGDMFMDNYNGFSLSEMNPYQEFKGTLKDKKGYLFQPYTVTLLRFTAKAGQKEKVKK